MSESAVSQDDAAKRASEQARLRKERREAKIKAGGSARLNRITGLGGRGKASPSFLVAIPSLFLTCLIEIEPPADSETTASTTATDVSPAAAAAVPSDASAPAPAAHADPDEVDISDHYYEPKMAAARAAPSASAVPAMSEDDLRKMMLGFEAGNTPRQPTPGLAGSGAGLDEDPMMKIMSQLMSGAGFPPAQPQTVLPPSRECSPRSEPLRRRPPRPTTARACPDVDARLAHPARPRRPGPGPLRRAPDAFCRHQD